MSDKVMEWGEGVQRLIGRDSRGGRVVLEASTIHAHVCRFWRLGKSHGPCSCGASALWGSQKARMVEVLGALDEDGHGWISAQAVPDIAQEPTGMTPNQIRATWPLAVAYLTDEAVRAALEGLRAEVSRLQEWDDLADGGPVLFAYDVLALIDARLAALE